MKLTHLRLSLPGLAPVAGICLLTTVVVPAAAQVLDQHQDLYPYSFNGDATWARWQQEITVGIAGPLAGVELYVYGEGGRPPGDAQIYINAGAPWQYDSADFETHFDPPVVGWNYIDVSSAGLVFDVGDKFVIGVQGVQEDFWFGGSSPSPGGPYDRGMLWFEESPYQSGQYDMAFRTYVGEPGLVGDLDGDGDVDLADLAALLAVYDTCEGDPGYDPAADFDGSGCIDLADLAALLANYGA